ncbi:diguanylate cyclase response regulator [Candidatus Parcubacteria bacterium]|nr:diguanylate cyclase response regulator [Candidatus Parcubacteria bacterium]
MTTTGKPFVLIVDDDKSFREMVKNHFSLMGYRASIAPTIKGAMEMVRRSHDIGIALVDWHMQGGAIAAPLLNLIVERASDRIKAYILTGSDKPGLKHAAVFAGAHRYLIKSVDSLDIIERFMQMDYEMMEGKIVDGLTGLLNYAGFFHAVVAEMKTARDHPDDKHPSAFSLLFVDIDKFKSVNDTYGYAVGSKVIAAVGKNLSRHVRPTDRLCRWGGDEFLILLPDTKLEGAVKRGEALREAVMAEPFQLSTGEPVLLDISVGASEIKRENIGEDVEWALDDLISRANVGERDVKSQRGLSR